MGNNRRVTSATCTVSVEALLRDLVIESLWKSQTYTRASLSGPQVRLGSEMEKQLRILNGLWMNFGLLSVLCAVRTNSSSVTLHVCKQGGGARDDPDTVENRPP